MGSQTHQSAQACDFVRASARGAHYLALHCTASACCAELQPIVSYRLFVDEGSKASVDRYSSVTEKKTAPLPDHNHGCGVNNIQLWAPLP